MSYSSLLIAHDGSRHSGVVIDALGPLLRPGIAVTLVHVEDVEGEGSEGVTASERALLEHGVAYVRRDIPSGDPAGVILDIAERLKPDLVAMSTHGRSGVQRWIRGSVAERVLRSCPVPLFMINPFTHDGTDMNSILVPLDRTGGSAEILDSLLPLARAYASRLTLLYVDRDDPSALPGQAALRRRTREKDVEAWLAGPRRRAEEEGLEVDVRVAFGDVAVEILRLAQRGEHDLVAMSTHARAGASRWLLGSIAEKVMRECGIPVLLHRVS